MLPFSRRANSPYQDAEPAPDPYGARHGSLPPAFTSAGAAAPFQRNAMPSPAYGFPAPHHHGMHSAPASVELAPEIHADARRYGTPYPPHSLSPVAMGAYGGASGTGPNLAQTVSSKRASLSSGLAILVAGVVAGGSFGIFMKAQQDSRYRAAAAARQDADPSALEAAAEGVPYAPTNAVSPATNLAPMAPNVATMAPRPGAVLAPAPVEAGPEELAQAPVQAPVQAPRAGVAAPARGRLATGRAPARGAARTTVVKEAPPPPAPRAARVATPPPAPAAKAGGIRTVKIQAPAAEAPVKEAPVKEAPAAKETASAKEPPAKAAPKAGRRDTKSTDDLLEEAIKNTSNVL